MTLKRVGIIALVVGALLAVPFLLMQFQIMVYDPGSGMDGVNWSLSDFVLMGAILFVTGLLLDMAWRKAGEYRIYLIGGIVVLFLWLWVELAVGLFTTWGS